MPMSTAAFTPFLASRMMMNRPANMVTTVSTMVLYSLPMWPWMTLGVMAPKKSRRT